MQIFRKNESQLSSAASERLQKLLGGRTNFSGNPETAQILVTPPPQAISPTGPMPRSPLFRQERTMIMDIQRRKQFRSMN